MAQKIDWQDLKNEDVHFISMLYMDIFEKTIFIEKINEAYLTCAVANGDIVDFCADEFEFEF